jgi:tRNA (adenine57-N1/adenine58-N1)-methyltransferase
MFSGEQTIADGSMVIVYEDHKHLSPLLVQAGQTLNNRFGAFLHNAMIGKQYGEQLVSRNGRGYVYLLAPSPELWTSSLSHRTQILYLADIAMVCLQLEVLPGSVVIEAGTGSGSLSHALARSVGETGHLHTYEFNSARAEQAAREFESNGLSPGRVTCSHGDVCQPDWEYAGLAHGSVDAAFFDLPQPWDAVPRAAAYLRPGGRLATFSPCIEQVARTLHVLPAFGFTRPEVLEVLIKTYEVREAPQSDAILEAVQRAEREAGMSAGGRAAGIEDGARVGVEAGGSRVVEAAETDDVGAGEDGDAVAVTSAPGPSLAGGRQAADQPAAKRRRADEGSASAQASGGSGAAAGPSSAAHGGAPATSGAPARPASWQPARLVTKAYDDMRGHTGFLMFCSKHV